MSSPERVPKIVKPSSKWSSKSIKVKKDKSTKKRKAEVLTEAPLPTTSTPSPGQEKVATVSDDEVEVPNDDSDESSEQPPPKKRKALAAEEIEVDITKPEPPSKKALRALKKGKPLPPPKSGADTTPEPEEKAAKKTEVEKRSEHGVWVGNLAFHVSKDDLRTFLTEKSDITAEMITRIHMPGPNDSKSANKVSTSRFKRVDHNKGFAYVDFSTAKGVEVALELSEELLSGRRVLIKDNKSFEGRPEKTKEESRNDGKPPSTRIFLGNLSFDTTEDSLKEHFEKCGPIESIKIATFEDSGKCKGFAWIVFEELAAAESAVKGFVRIEEEISGSESESSDEGSDSDAPSKPKLKKTKLRKWWVNKIKGRPLRMEFAEGAQVRYKKRYGKDGTKPAAAPSEEYKERNGKPTKVVEYRQPYAARLTGGIVESKGSKTTF